MIAKSYEIELNPLKAWWYTLGIDPRPPKAKNKRLNASKFSSYYAFQEGINLYFYQVLDFSIS